MPGLFCSRRRAALLRVLTPSGYRCSRRGRNVRGKAAEATTEEERLQYRRLEAKLSHVDTNSEFFFGSGDGSSGYYAERPELALALARYERMP